MLKNGVFYRNFIFLLKVVSLYIKICHFIICFKRMGIHIKGEMARENIETAVVVKTDKGKIQRERDTLVCFHNKKIPLYVMEKICRTLDDDVSWFGAVVTLRGVKPILKLIFQEVIYFLWRERNIWHHSSVLKPASLVLIKILLLRVWFCLMWIHSRLNSKSVEKNSSK